MDPNNRIQPPANPGPNYNLPAQSSNYGPPQPNNPGWMMPQVSGYNPSLLSQPNPNPNQTMGYQQPPTTAHAFPSTPNQYNSFPTSSVPAPPPTGYYHPQSQQSIPVPPTGYMQPQSSVPVYNPNSPHFPQQHQQPGPPGAVPLHPVLHGKDEQKRLKKMQKEHEKMEKKQRKAMKHLH